MISMDAIFILPWLLFGLLGVLIVVGVPIAMALVLTAVGMVILDPRLTYWVMFQRMYNGMDSFVLLAVPLFLLAGNLMNAARITDRLITLCMRLVGHVKGALAHVNVMVSMLFAGVSGSSTADSAGVGTVLIPAMQREGYPTHFAVAVTAASSVMGIIIPPSINMIVWGALTNTSIAGLFLGGILPGVMIGVAQLLMNMGYVRRYQVPVRPRASWRQLASSSKDGLLAAGIPVVIIGGITLGIVTPTEAAVIAVLYALILGFIVYRELSFRQVLDASTDTVRLCSLSLFSLVGAAIFGYLISFYQIPPKLMEGVNITNPVTLLIIMTLVMLLIGTFMDSLPAMAIMAPIFQPLAMQAGVHPVQFGVIGVMALGLGLITPPYGLCLMISAKIGGIPLLKALATTLLYLAVMLAVILLLIVFPDIVLAIPRLIAPDFV
ncbi:C4-dicarboxylate ABC transporter permease [Halomonas litopenaei]|uniref:TRAP transporter large permease protein n=1 Tax=Halomonas litopenaei TaxID=2109328 RepID=A0ABX5J387_9GAMM|nr:MULTISPECIES: TRAP transporter large permease [Halomonas]MBS8267539.1 TRAP transporter large permease [Halomonas litopenaei]MBY5943009.1 TRAP transporter large permease [Halomonas sp. DP5N14-9]PTL90183.1 C4-dicarboxylate ABC transporter permease [Halomonas sp. SYSU XM8]PTL95511.1 C4-dicarboxylate ABC transporter permease [Halomonas litopenaei]USZ50177.1 TRAP transporter large permease [Halomonas sp. DN3]|tara:strand:- start:360 stop:1667 length:1308 start_codon:yes stop_codon:yes gene_type:complete